jgi:membrane fusion protein (multidrug efflux system)
MKHHSLPRLLLALAALASCTQAPPYVPASKPSVSTAVVQARSIEMPVSFIAQTRANRRVEIRSRVAGALVKQEYVGGQKVQAGQLLHEIDRRPFEAALVSAKAQLEQAQAKRADADLAVQRKTALVAADAAAQKELDDARSALRNAQAQVDIAESGVQRAQLDLEYTRLAAPFDGRVGREQRDVGSLVDAGSNSLLTFVQETDPILVTFRISENQLLEWRRSVELGLLATVGPDELRVAVETLDGVRHPDVGVLSFRAIEIDPATGTGEVNARIPNKDERLLPGQFVHAVLLGLSRPQVITVPQRAVVISSSGATVYVREQGKATARPVVLGDWVGGEWLIEEGLKEGEELIVEGVQRIRPGSEVTVVSANAVKAN